MTINNKYIIRSEISEAKFRELIKCFSLDLEILQIAELTRLNRNTVNNTVNRYLKLIRLRIAEYCDSQSPFVGEIELDKSYFGAHRVRGKRGRGSLR